MTQTKNLRPLFALLLLCVFITGSKDALANSEKKEEKVVVPGAVYYNLAPPFIVSFQGEKRLRFLKVDVTLRLQSMETQEHLLHQMPRVRNDLIMLFSSQPEAALVSAEGKEKLRQDALKKIRELLANEGKAEDVLDLLFMNFVVQN